MNFNEIRDLYKKIDTTKYNPYPVDWIKIFTPIEYAIWSDIRDYNMQMWPQFPIGKYFADFANVKHKIVIECDGKQWHNKVKDKIRDDYMKLEGWTVYRITGSECIKTAYLDQDEDYEEKELLDFYHKFYKTGSGVVKAIYYIHYKEFKINPLEIDYMNECLKLHIS